MTPAPRGLKELLGTGLSLALDGLWQSVSILAVAILPGMLFVGLVTARLGLTDKESIQAALEAGRVAPILVAAAAGAAASLLALAAMVAVILSLAARERGEILSLGDAYGRAADGFVPFLMVQFRVFVYVALGLLLLIVPGVIFSIRYMLAPFAVLLEGRTGGAALSRSKELMAGHSGKVLGNLAVTGLLVGILTLLVQVVFSLASALAGSLAPAFAFASELASKTIATWALAVGILLYKDLTASPPDAPSAS